MNAADYGALDSHLEELRELARQRYEARGGRWPFRRPAPTASDGTKARALAEDLRGLIADAHTAGRHLAALVYEARQLVPASDLASCGHPRNEDGECPCAWWPERAPEIGGPDATA